MGKLQDSRVDPAALSVKTRHLLFQLKRALADEGWIAGAQITFDEVKVSDWPPTVDIKVIREAQADGEA